MRSFQMTSLSSQLCPLMQFRSSLFQKKLPYLCPPHQPQAQQLLPHLGPHSSTQSGKYLQAMSSLETSISSDLSLYGQDWHLVGAQYLQDQ